RILEAWDRRHDRPVAIKQLLNPGRDAVERFLREAAVTARLQHPSIIALYEAARWPSGEPFLALKLVVGRSLADVIAATPDLKARLGLLPHLIAVVEALAYAHARGIIHRDLKPANVLVGDFGESVVIDWGLAKDLGAADATPDATGVAGPDLTVAGRALGTPAY